MKLFAQHGFGVGEKVTEGFERGLIDGVIFSPKDIPLEKLRSKILDINRDFPLKSILFDPQLYACFMGNFDGARLGNLIEDYGAYFQPRMRSHLEREKAVRDEIGRYLRFQIDLRVSGLIAPNIIISRSFDSVEAVISKNFIRLAGELKAEINDSRPLFVTLAISRNALLDKAELINFLNEITVLENPPDGFYLLIATETADSRQEIFHADVVAGWMMLNHVLKINGFKVINGYSDLLGAFLCGTGGEASATGWWSNLRAFSLDRFAPNSGGGKLPIQKYLSSQLLNRISYFELNKFRDRIPEILNGLASDVIFPVDSEPQRNLEVLQSWDALKKLNQEFSAHEEIENIRVMQLAIISAREAYTKILALGGIRLDQKSNDEHLDALEQGIKLFVKLAELNL